MYLSLKADENYQVPGKVTARLEGSYEVAALVVELEVIANLVVVEEVVVVEEIVVVVEIGVVAEVVVADVAVVVEIVEVVGKHNVVVVLHCSALGLVYTGCSQTKLYT